LNPSDFVEGEFKAEQPEPLGEISSLLRRDPSLDSAAAEALDLIVRTAYERLRKGDR
jgi:hypothetical protein